MNKQKQKSDNRVPFTRDEIIREVRLAALGLASHIANLGPSKRAFEIAALYLGAELDCYEYEANGNPPLDKIPIETHVLYTTVMDAYDYAYQVGNNFDENDGVDGCLHEVAGILTGFPQTDFNGEPTPLSLQNPQKLRQVLDTFIARYSLSGGENLTVTELALLANMSEATVRTSLSAEGIKTIAPTDKGEKNRVPHADAISWLAGRRSFVPTRDRRAENSNREELMTGLFRAESFTFEAALKRALATTVVEGATLAKELGEELDWLDQLQNADAVMAINVPALEALSRLLGAPPPIFVGRAVSTLLSRRELLGNG